MKFLYILSIFLCINFASHGQKLALAREYLLNNIHKVETEGLVIEMVYALSFDKENTCFCTMTSYEFLGEKVSTKYEETVNMKRIEIDYNRVEEAFGGGYGVSFCIKTDDDTIRNKKTEYYDSKKMYWRSTPIFKEENMKCFSIYGNDMDLLTRISNAFNAVIEECGKI